MNHRFLVALVRHAVRFGLAWFAAAAATAAPAPGEVSRASHAWTVPLSRLLGTAQTLRVQGVHGELRFSLPVPALWRTEEVTLEVSGAVSRALSGTSQLAVEVNGRVVHQRALDGSQSALRLSAPIPPSRLHDGDNEVRLLVTQHYTDRCEYPMAPQLWTEIDPKESRFVIRASPRPVVPTLDRLDALFDKAEWDEQPVVAVMNAGPRSASMVGAMGLVAQGIGQRYDDLPARILAARMPMDAGARMMLPAAARGAVVLGTFASVRSLLPPELLAGDPGGPIVLLRRAPGDAARFLVVLAAKREEELPTVAAAFALPRMPWPARPWAAVRELNLPSVGALRAAASQAPSTHAAALSAFGYRTATYTGMAPRGAVVRFWNPAWQGRAQVRVHLAYGAGMSPQAALNLVANGVVHDSIPLSNPEGGSYDAYALTIPGGALRPGWNTLELQPVLIPQSNGGDCKPFFPGNLAVTIYDDTTLQTMGGSPLRRPDLALFAATGRPVPGPLRDDMSVHLTDGDNETLGAGLTLMAKLAQSARTPLLHADFRIGPSRGTGATIWVGAFRRLPPRVRAAMAVDERGGLEVAVPLLRTTTIPVREGADTASALFNLLGPPAAEPATLATKVALAAAVDDRSMAVTTLLDDRPLTVFAALTPPALQAGVDAVIGHGPWGQLRGGLAMWRAERAEVQTLATEDAPFEAFSLRGGLGLWVSQYPWWALALLVLLLALLAMGTRVVLGIYRRRQRDDANSGRTTS